MVIFLHLLPELRLRKEWKKAEEALNSLVFEKDKKELSMNRIEYDELFCYIDDFCKGFEPWYHRQLLGSGAKKRNRKGKMSLSEIMTITIGFHRSGMSCFKYYYEELQRN